MNKKGNSMHGMELAVIGMAGRFPGAVDIHAFWDNLKEGRESISFFSTDELLQAGVDTELTDNPRYVKAMGAAAGKEFFDASFFGYTPREAGLMDPQVRVFHEYAWKALEDAGYDPGTFDGLIGLYAGATNSFYWESMSYLAGIREQFGEFEANILSSKDFLATRISYQLNFKGPSFSVQTACSTSLVAIHLACRALMTGECKLALAGGVSLSSFNKQGYLHQEGMVLSSDGHCRAFDAAANGTVPGEGIGIVVLKRLKEAVKDRDHIYAVVKGSAINNDGKRKVGYTAPSGEGQVEAIVRALRMAKVEPGSITYIETHGTGTVLGDPIEVHALKKAFDTRANEKGTCGIGAVKSNIGHLDAAAGAAGFIKTVLALKHRLIPPSLHFKTPNPKIDFQESPFYVNTALKEWTHDHYPLRAGVSSFGIGGTNAHVVLEQAPSIEPAAEVAERTYKLLVLSARTEPALEQMTANLSNYFRENRANNLADAAYTLMKGRARFPYRNMVVCSGIDEAVNGLIGEGGPELKTYYCETEGERPVIFMFPGQGSQYVDMGLELYKTEPVFREAVDCCFEMLTPILGYDVKDLLYPSFNRSNRSYETHINQTEITQPVIFAFEYALAKLLLEWGIKPYAMIGHSIGEYTAACLSGVFSLQDALKLVAVRGQLMQRLPAGAMLSVPLPEQELIPLLDADVSLAAVNSSSRCTVSGTFEAIADFSKRLKEKGYESKPLHTSHAFHSAMMDPILEEFETRVKSIQLNTPQIPFISNVTGEWVTTEEAVRPSYWASHLRETVQFEKGLRNLLQLDKAVFIEVGPGTVLNTLVKKHKNKKTDHVNVNLIRHPQEQLADTYYLLDRIGRLWLYGVEIDWNAFYGKEERHRISLPGYPFQHKRYWIDHVPLKRGMEIAAPGGALKKKEIRDWFYIPSWKRSGLVVPPIEEEQASGDILVFTDTCHLGNLLAVQMKQKGHRVTMVKPGSRYAMENSREFVINPKEKEDYQALFDDLIKNNKVPGIIIHLWTLTGGTGSETHEGLLDLGFYSQLYICQAIAKKSLSRQFQIIVISNHIQEVTGDEELCPAKAAVLGPMKVIPQEFSNIRYRNIDIVLPAPDTRQMEKLVNELSREMLPGPQEVMVAYRNQYRWVRTYEPVRIEEKVESASPLRQRGVYMITGGLGRIGLILAKYLAQKVQAKCVLVGRSEPGQRDAKIKQVKEIEQLGGDVLLVKADVSNLQQMQAVIDQSEKTFGPLNGVIHAAGVTRDHVLGVENISPSECETQFQPKIYGLLVLEKLLRHKSLDFCLLTSSLAAVLGGLGFAAYAAANVFMDVFVQEQSRQCGFRWVSVNWDGWKLEEEMDSSETAILPGGGEIAFHRILSWSGPGEHHILVSPTDLQARLDRWINRCAPDPDVDEQGKAAGESKSFMDTRPDLPNPYAPPRTQLETLLAETWQEFFRFEKVGINDNFFELGGDSLSLVTAAAKIHKKLNVEISIAEFYNHPTIEKLAKRVQTKQEHTFISLTPAEKKEYYPLSSAQKRLFNLVQMDRNNVGYNLTQAFVLKGHLDIIRLEMAFKKLIHRHEILRTAMTILHDEPVQRIRSFIPFDIDYREADEKAVPGMIENFIKPFDPAQAPLFRVGVIKCTGIKNILIIDEHHLITDGVSHQLFIRDLMRCYRDEELPGLEYQYRDYAEWENSKQEQERLQVQEAYWLKQFEGQIPVLDMPTDFPRPAKKDYSGDVFRVDLPRELSRALNELAKETGATLFMVLLSAYYILLSKYTRQEDIVVGAAVPGRRHDDLREIMGMFVNMLALRNFPHSRKTCREFLAEVRKNTLNAFDNQDYPFDRLVMKLGLHRFLNRNPLFDTALLMEIWDNREIDMGRLNGDRLEVTAYDMEHKGSVFDLVVLAIETEEGIRLQFTYSTALFKRSKIEKMAKHYIEIMEQMAVNGFIELKDISISHELLKVKSKILQEDQQDFGF